MKRLVLLLIACSSVVNLYGQAEVDKKNLIGSHIAPGLCFYLPIFSFGIDYERELKDRWSFCSGLEGIAFTDIPYGGVNCVWFATSIPIQFKHNFRKHYFHFGTSLDLFHADEDPSISLGGRLGIGFEREFNGVRLSLNPYIKWNGILSHLSGLEGSPTFFVLGVSLGIGWHKF